MPNCAGSEWEDRNGFERLGSHVVSLCCFLHMLTEDQPVGGTGHVHNGRLDLCKYCSLRIKLASVDIRQSSACLGLNFRGPRSAVEN